jgi:hypothetical protein
MGFVIALVLVACFPSHAATVTQSHFPPNPGLMPGGGWTWATNSNWADPPPPRQWTNGTYGGVKGVTAVDTWGLSGRAGALTVQRPIFSPLTAVGAAIARCMGNFACAVVSGVAVASLPAAMDRLRVARDPETGNVMHDPGVLPGTETANAYCSSRLGVNPSTGNNCWPASTATSRCSSYAIPANYGQGADAHCQDDPGNSRWIVRGWSDTSNSYVNLAFWGYDVATIEAPAPCPASIDPLNPAYNVPAGEPVGIDGRCPTARYNWAPITPDQVGQRLDQYDPGSQQEVDRLIDALRDALQRGEQVPGSESLPMTGPGSQTGTPSTTTTTLPGGGTRIETRTPTYTYSYGDTTITYNTTYTTIINDNGEVTTIEEGGAPQEQSDFCVDNPNVLACLQLGDPPSAPQPPSEQVITYEVDALGLPAGCPAPMEATFPVVGLVSVAWTPICDLAPLVRAMLLAMSAFGAALVIVMNVRQAA